MSTKAKRHPHKYHRITLAFGEVWACALPDCTHYMPNHMEGILPGKRSVCWGCGEVFILDPINMKDKQPKCLDCRTGHSITESHPSETTEVNASDAIKKFLEGLV